MEPALATAGPGSALEQLEAALRQLGTSLATADLESLLGSDAALANAVGRASGSLQMAPGDSEHLRQAVDRVRQALMRCRRLGATLDEFARFSLQARGIGVEYGPQGIRRPDVRGALSERA